MVMLFDELLSLNQESFSLNLILNNFDGLYNFIPQFNTYPAFYSELNVSFKQTGWLNLAGFFYCLMSPHSCCFLSTSI